MYVTSKSISPKHIMSVVWRAMVGQNEGVLPQYENLIKAEAIKEFAERMKRRMGFCDLPNGIVRSHIDNLAKEMTQQ